MSLSIGKLNEQIRRKLAGGDIPKDFPISKEEVALFIIEKSAYILGVQLIEGIKYDNNRSVNPHFIGSYEANIAFDDSKNYFYVDLPVTFINMMGNRGIQRVTPKGGSWQDDLIPLTVGSAGLISGTPAGNLQGDVGYYPQGSRIILYTPERRKPPKSVVLQLVTAEDVDIDPAVADGVRDMAVAFYIERVPQDMLNDENSDVLTEQDK